MNHKKDNNLSGAESQAIAAGGKAAIELGAKAATEGVSAEEAVTGTLGVVAAAAAPFVPWGTVASVVIMAGITIFKAVSAAEKAEVELNKKIGQLESKLDYMKVIKDTIEKGKIRPRMPLDLYSGPPMYWIVESPEYDETKEPEPKGYYTLPNGSVYWPHGNRGGFTPMSGVDKKNINTDYIYAPFKPNLNNNPSICIFFWAVPIFFARLQQLIGEQKYKEGYDPKGVDPDTGKPIEVELAQIIKQIIQYGKLDAAGNWYAKIGPVIPALAFNDDDYASRYYGRNAWVHNLAMQNIKFADGSRIFSSGAKYAPAEYFNSPIAKQTMALSKEYAEAKPNFVVVAGKPYYLANSLVNAPTPVMNSGQVLDLYGLVSHYDKWDGSFKNAREMLRKSPNVSDDTLYYVVSIPKFSESRMNSSYIQNLTSLLRDAALATVVGGGLDNRMKKAGNLHSTINFTYDIYATAIRNAGGFLQTGLSTLARKPDSSIGFSLDFSSMDSAKTGSNWTTDFVASRIHGNFALAPYQLYIASKCAQLGEGKENLLPRPYIGPPYSGQTGNASAPTNNINSTYGFFDFDPEPTPYEETIGLWEGDKNTGKFDWIRNLAIMCGFKASPTESEDFQYSATIWPTKLENSSNSAADVLQVHRDYDLEDASMGAKNETFYYRTFNISSILQGFNEVIKLRPPMKGEPTIKLSKEFWGEAEPWAKLQGKDEVDFALVKAPTIAVFAFRREPLILLGSKYGAPLTKAYYKTNLEENKPIVELQGKSNPSPFYCGRRADPRTQWAWRKLRVSSLGDNEETSKDTGWEDCHEWSWPYQTPVLAEIGRISKKMYDDLGEGIGRSGLSLSSIATGPTLWGDVALYISRYSAIKGGSSSIKSPAFKKFQAMAFWTAIIEMQTGAYSRYSYLKNNINDSFAEDVQKQFAMFTNKVTAKNAFLSKAKAHKELTGYDPCRFNPVTGAKIEMTPEQAAEYCMNIVDAWFDGTFPKPTQSFQDTLNKKNWDADTLDRVCRAHIRLKNWAIDLGLPENKRKGHKFPSDVYSINFFGLNKASRIAIESYNSVVDEKAEVTNPFQKGINETFHYDKKSKILLSENRKKPISPLLSPPVMITAAATLATVAIISRLKGRK